MKTKWTLIAKLQTSFAAIIGLTLARRWPGIPVRYQAEPELQTAVDVVAA